MTHLATTALAVLAVLLLATGCGDKHDKDQVKADQRAMVPSGADSARADSTGADSLDVDSVAVEFSGVGGVGEPADELKPAGTAPAATAPARVSAKESPPVGTFNLQLGSFRSAENAEALAGRVRALGRTPYVEVATLGGQTYHRVVLRGLTDRNQAERLGESLRDQLGITYLIRQN